MDSEASCKTVQILIRWLHQKPADLDLHCFQNRIYPGTAEQGLSFSCFYSSTLPFEFEMPIQPVSDIIQLLTSMR